MGVGGWGGEEEWEMQSGCEIKTKNSFFLFVKFLSKNKIAIVKEIQFLC